MRIAQLATTFLPRIGGAEVVVHNLSMHLRRRGHDVTVITWWGLWAQVARSLPYPVRPLLPRSFEMVMSGLKRGVDARWIVGLQVAAYQRRYRFDVWHHHQAFPLAAFSLPALRRARVPSIITSHGADVFLIPECGCTDRADPVRGPLILEALRGADQLIAISRSVRDEFAALGMEPARIRDIPNGIDVERIEGHAADRDAVRRRLGLPPDRFVLLTVGRNHLQKGYRYVPDILRHLRQKRRDFCWVIVGLEMDSVQRAVNEAGLADHFRAIGEIGLAAGRGGSYSELPAADVIDLYKSADVFVSPSIFEAMPLVLIEAMAAGLPVVASDVIGCRDVVADGETGFLCGRGDAAGFAARIDAVLADAGLRARLAEQARKSARRYAWPVVAAEHIALFEELARGRGGGRKG